MKNITVSVPDDLYRRARVKAAQQDTTVTAVVRDHLQNYAAEPAAGQPTKQDEEPIGELLARIRAAHPDFSASDRLTREELYDRDAAG